MQNMTPGHCVYIKNMKIIANEWQKQRTIKNRKETGFNESRKFIRVYLTVYISIQQKKTWKFT